MLHLVVESGCWIWAIHFQRLEPSRVPGTLDICWPGAKRQHPCSAARGCVISARECRMSYRLRGLEWQLTMGLVLATYLEDPTIKQSSQLFLPPASVCTQICWKSQWTRPEFTKSIDSQVDQGAQSDAEHLAVLDDGSAVGASAKGRVWWNAWL